MVGSFLGIGTPLKLIDKLTANKQVKRFIGAHIGTDPSLGKQHNNKEVEIEFNPMGTWIERTRAAGAGLGGVLTPTGLGTEMEEGREM